MLNINAKSGSKAWSYFTTVKYIIRKGRGSCLTGREVFLPPKLCMHMMLCSSALISWFKLCPLHYEVWEEINLSKWIRWMGKCWCGRMYSRVPTVEQKRANFTSHPLSSGEKMLQFIFCLSLSNFALFFPSAWKSTQSKNEVLKVTFRVENKAEIENKIKVSGV